MNYYVINAEFNEIVCGPMSLYKATKYLQGIKEYKDVYCIVKIVVYGSD